MFQIQGKVALITGGASGIGLEYAKELLRNGLRAVTLADVNEELGRNAVNAVTEEFGMNRVIFVKSDVTNKEQFENVFKSTIAEFKNVDIVINNAGMLDDSIWEKEILVNINGTVHGTLLAFDTYLPQYRTGSEGVIVNVSSINGLEEQGSMPIYSATKHAIIGLSRSFGSKLNYERSNVKVLTLCPGLTDTDMVRRNNKEDKSLGPKYKEQRAKEFGHCIPQEPEFVAKALMDVIKDGKTGSIWVVENRQPAYEVVIPKYQTLRKI